MLGFVKKYNLILAIAFVLISENQAVPTAVKFDHLDLNQELILTDVEEIKAFFKHVSSKLPAIEKQQPKSQHENSLEVKSRREDGRAFLSGAGAAAAGNLVGQAGAGTLGGLLGGATTNIFQAAGTLIGAAAAAAAANQQATAQGQDSPPRPIITAMSPAQQLLNLRTCPAHNMSVCAPAAQCLLAGGVSIGNCAMGLLVCCTQRQEIPYTCSATNNLVSIKDKVSTISNNDIDRSCQFEIYKADTNICQLELNFETFEMETPLWGEDCPTESVMTVTDSVTVRNGFPLCGKHNGTKMYLAYGRSSRITLAFVRSPKDAYRIRIRQIECTSAERIPDQCLQNHEGYTGLVKSFGFPQYMINNQKYTICINAKSVTDIGKITWRECSSQEAGSDSSVNFLMSEYFAFEAPPESTNATDYYTFYNYYNSQHSQLFIPSEGFTCSKTSYVEVHGQDKHCGARFLARSKSLKSEARPYMLSVNIVEDSAENLPDFAMYQIPGIRRSSAVGGFPEQIPENDCEYSSTDNSTMPSMIPSTQGFEPCKILTKHKLGVVMYDLCVCSKKEGIDLPEKPKMRPDLMERKGFCLHYSVS